jgi:5'-deoxynucleotidase YfbR-like HD superfamily hydrolase
MIVRDITFRRLLLMRGVARVARMHTMPTLRTQTVGEHTFGLLAILDYVMSPEPVPQALFRAALYHDAPEYITGDTPSTAKWASSNLEDSLKFVEQRIETQYDLPKLATGTVEKDILKFCDLMELGIFCLEEYRMGDYRMKDVCNRVIEAVEKRGISGVRYNATLLYDKFVLDVKDGTNYLNGVKLHVG